MKAPTLSLLLHTMVRKLDQYSVYGILTDPSTPDKLDLNSLLVELKKLGIRSLMVEGGASVISSFFQSGLVKSLIVTVSPVTVGGEGIGYDDNGEARMLFSLESQLHKPVY